jgi:hypothetical protein
LALGPDERANVAAEAGANIRLRFTRERMCADTLAVYRELV